MEEKKNKISLATYVSLLILMLVIIVGLVFVITRKNDNHNEYSNKDIELNSNNDNLEIKNENEIISNIKYIEVEIPDTEAVGLELKEKVKILDKEVLLKIEKEVNSGIEYEPRGTAWPDISPMITFYLENGEIYSSFVVDGMMEPQEEDGNYITMFKMNDDEYRKTYRIEEELEKYIIQIYNEYR